MKHPKLLLVQHVSQSDILMILPINNLIMLFSHTAILDVSKPSCLAYADSIDK